MIKFELEKYLSDWLLDRSWYTTETDNMLFDMLLKKCLDEKIILPGFSTFERFVSKIIDSSEKSFGFTNDGKFYLYNLRLSNKQVS